MNKKQAARAIAVIKKDATGTGRLLNYGGEMCVLGGLLSNARVPKADLMMRTMPSDEQAALLWRSFGIDRELLTTLVNVNDDTEGVSDRRKALIRVVRAAVA